MEARCDWPCGHQQGFALVSTIFLLVVISSLGAYMVTLATSQHLSSSLAAQNARALFAAVSGLEWTAYEISNNPGACPTVPTSFVAEGFTITLSGCSRSVVSEGGSSYSLYDVTVDASRGGFGDPGFVSRRLRVTLNE